MIACPLGNSLIRSLRSVQRRQRRQGGLWDTSLGQPLKSFYSHRLCPKALRRSHKASCSQCTLPRRNQTRASSTREAIMRFSVHLQHRPDEFEASSRSVGTGLEDVHLTASPRRQTRDKAMHAIMVTDTGQSHRRRKPGTRRKTRPCFRSSGARRVPQLT